MTKEKAVDKLIANDDSVWTEDDRSFLMGLNERQLGGLLDQFTSNKIKETNEGEEEGNDGGESSAGDSGNDDQEGTKTAGGKAKTKKTTEKECANAAKKKNSEGDSEDEDMAENEDTSTDVDEFIANASPEVQEVLNEGRLALNIQKKEAIAVITANKANPFTEEELSKMSLNDLRKLAKLATPVAAKKQVQGRGMFAGNALTVENGSEDEVLALPSMDGEFKKK